MVRRGQLRMWKVVGCAFVLFAAYGRSVAAPTPPPAATLGQTNAPAGAAKAATSQSAKLAERAWWNQPDVIKTLQLKDAQRTKMDALMARTFEAQRTAQQAQIISQKALEEALSKGDWDAARKASGKLKEGMAALWAAQTDLKIDALAELDAKQRETVVKQYHQLLQQPSVLWAPRAPGAPNPEAAKPK